MKVDSMKMEEAHVLKSIELENNQKMNKKQVTSKNTEITKLTEAKKAQKESEIIQIQKAKAETHDRIRSLENDLKEAELSAEVDRYISVSGSLKSAETFLEILDQREADLDKPTAVESAKIEGLKQDLQSISNAVISDTAERLKPITAEILKIFEENDTALETAKKSITEYCALCGAEGVDRIVFTRPSNATWLMNFYLAAVKFNEALSSEDFYRLLGIPKNH